MLEDYKYSVRITTPGNQYRQSRELLQQQKEFSVDLQLRIVKRKISSRETILHHSFLSLKAAKGYRTKTLLVH